MQEVWVMLALRPKWCEPIIDGKKGWEIRKTMPKLKPPFKVLIYETKDKKFDGIGVHWADGRDFIHHIGKVIGEFICDDIAKIRNLGARFVAEGRSQFETNTIARSSCLDFLSMKRYLGKKDGYAWHISDLVIYDKPKSLGEFYKCGAETLEELMEQDSLCGYCSDTGYGEYATYGTPNGPVMCEGAYCDKAYQEYLDENFALTRPPQSWCYVEAR